MKALIRIDTDQRWPDAIDLFLRLDFEDPKVVLVHCLETSTTAGLLPEGQIEFTNIRQHEADARRELDAAGERLRTLGIDARDEMLEGAPVQLLIELADSGAADLVVTGSTSKGKYGSLFFGSVTKGLTIGAHQSLLISKKRIEHDGPLTAVIATDHSSYMNDCITHLLALHPKGIGRITVLTANKVDETATALLVWDVPEISAEAAGWVRAKLGEKTEDICRILEPLGGTCESRVLDMYPAEAIRSVMEDICADLLIIGARGHGFMERVTIGSHSLYQVITSPHNVLVLRLPPAESQRK